MAIVHVLVVVFIYQQTIEIFEVISEYKLMQGNKGGMDGGGGGGKYLVMLPITAADLVGWLVGRRIRKAEILFFSFLNAVHICT